METMEALPPMHFLVLNRIFFSTTIFIYFMFYLCTAKYLKYEKRRRRKRKKKKEKELATSTEIREQCTHSITPVMGSWVSLNGSPF
jgi:predicted membrane protein